MVPGTISNPAHSPFGGLTNAALGNGLAETRNYTNRGWLGSIGVGSVYSLSMGYAGNGNVTGAIDSENGNWTYNYDTLNRLQTAVIGGQTFTYSPDAYGNMTCTAPQGLACTPLGLNISPATNQITTSGYKYDAAGNLLSDNTHGYVYDAENRIACVGVDINGNCTPSSTYYLYDPQGQRAGKQQANTLEDYVYDPQGHIISVHDGSANLLRAELYTGGRHVATYNPGANYGPLFWNHADWLGTERVRTDSGGTARQFCLDSPYGMNLTCTPPDLSPMHFTGKQRDYESGLDNFGARYFGGGNDLGRFMTPDWSSSPEAVPYANLQNPQSLNLYGYVLNNPTTGTDPNGHWCLWGFGTTCENTNPPPAPPPPPAPAVITPGTPQNGLATAQANVRSDPAYQPNRDPNTGKETTFCNLATCNTVESVGGPSDAITDKNGQANVANTAAQQLPNSSQWHEVSPQEAQNLANQGVPIVGIQENPGTHEDGTPNHGHEVTVAPELMPGLTMHLYGTPLVNNVGGRVGVMSASQAFPDTTRPVHYYAPNHY